jgi:hypothetical protein
MEIFVEELGIVFLGLMKFGRFEAREPHRLSECADVLDEILSANNDMSGKHSRLGIIRCMPRQMVREIHLRDQESNFLQSRADRHSYREFSAQAASEAGTDSSGRAGRSANPLAPMGLAHPSHINPYSGQKSKIT